MNFDYVEVIKNISKDKICFDHLQMKSKYSTGWNMYELNGINKMNVWINPDEEKLRIKANLAYYWQGHNFQFLRHDMIEAINHTSNILNVNLLDSQMNKLEFGSIMQLDYRVEDFLLNHISMIGRTAQPFYTKSKLTGKYFSEPSSRFKMYNASTNMKNKLPKELRQKLVYEFGFNPKADYVKLETHYNKPHINFKDRNLLLNDIIQPVFITTCKAQLIELYKKIVKTGKYKLPDCKSQNNASTIPMLVLNEVCALHGLNPDSLLKQKIKSIPDYILSKHDKKARLTQIRSNQRKLTSSDSFYDITQLLENKAIL